MAIVAICSLNLNVVLVILAVSVMVLDLHHLRDNVLEVFIVRSHLTHQLQWEHIQGMGFAHLARIVHLEHWLLSFVVLDITIRQYSKTM